MVQSEAKNDKNIDLFAVRSLLFLPASNPRAIARAKEAGADLVVLDLEDAVRPGDKDAARDAAVEAVSNAWAMPVAIRVNGVGTEWHSLDIDAVARSKADLAVLPRATSGQLAHDFAEAVDKPVLAMVETAAGVLAAAEIAPQTAGLIAGTNDLRADLRLPLDAMREPISTALQLIVLAARAAGVAAFDGVFNKLEDFRRLPQGSSGRAAARIRWQEPHPSQSDRALPLRLRSERGGGRAGKGTRRGFPRRR